MLHSDDGVPASPRAVFGGLLRFYRMRAGMTRDQLGALVYLSGDMIGKIENGTRTASEQFTEACEAIPELRTDGALLELREQLKDYFRDRPFPGWFTRWVDAERAARVLRTFEPLVVPGLLQTEDYARAVLRTEVGVTEEEIEEMVAARLARQAVLEREKPPTLWAILDEGVLRRPVGGPGVMKGQLHRLIDAAHRPNIVIQVIPLSTGAHEGLRSAGFILADLDGAPGVAYQETALRGQIVEDADDIGSLMIMWDTLKSEALPRKASLDLMEEVLTTWT
ncbi:MAG TPA: helix-turn-helix transcriptional regulator [Streptosporangiaceae bacterium]|nr:helix-turn-helix transcriptional regulator [Streptosporangiaceae bacterium]